MALFAHRALPEETITRHMIQTENRTVGNTTVETDLIEPTTFPVGNALTEKEVEMHWTGFVSGVNTDTATVRVYLNTTKIIESVAAMPATFTNASFYADLLLTCRGGGKIIGQGRSVIYAGPGLITSYSRPLQMLSEITVDTTIAQTLRVTYQWSAAKAGNTITTTNANIFSANA